MELQQLRALIHVAESGSVTEAARRLLVTQPAVTRQIRALEEELGGVLFDRTTKPLAPTALGKVALEQARHILQLSDDLRAMVSSQAGVPTGELRLGVVHSLARQVVPPIVHAVRQQYPAVQLRVSSSWSSALRREVEDGLLDAAIVLLPPHPPIPTGIEAIYLAPEPITLVSSTKTGLKHTIDLEDLRGSEWVLSREGCGYRALLKRALEKASIPFTVVVEVLDIDLQLQLIAEGVGLGILAARALPQPLEEQGLQMFALSGPTFSLETWLLHRRTGPMTPVVVPVIEHTVATLLRQTTTFDTTARRGKKRPPEARQKA
jgi:DNA-binding transcriptional LysR family regulator